MVKKSKFKICLPTKHERAQGNRDRDKVSVHHIAELESGLSLFSSGETKSAAPGEKLSKQGRETNNKRNLYLK